MRLSKKRTLAVAGALISGWIFFFAQTHFSVSSQEKPKVEFLWRTNRLVDKRSWLEWGDFLPLNVSYQLLAGSVPAQQRFLTVGISSVQRKKDQYLQATLESIFSQSSEKESSDMVVVVLIADFDRGWRTHITEEIQKSFPSQLSTGQLLLVHVPQEFYPPLAGLKRNYNDAADRVSFRSKQNVDYSYLVHYSAALGQYYLQLEDDVSSAKNFLSKIRLRVTEQNAKKKSTWSCLEFSTLGYIGKLYKSQDLPLLARFLFLFYQEMPCDWLMTRFRDLLAQREPIIFRPSLFQHMGTFSSFKGTHNKLKDKDFEEDFANPEADVFSNMSVYQKHFAHLAWTSGGDYFWGRTPGQGDYVTVVLKTPAVLTDIIVETGDGGKDVLISAHVEIGRDVVSTGKERSCGSFVSVGQIDKGKFEAQELDQTHNFASSCLRIRVTAPQTEWVIIKRIRVAIKTESKTNL